MKNAELHWSQSCTNMKLNGKGNNRQQNKEIDMEMLHEHR